jgi:tetratricopeptide (TPR) repeat protein
MTDEITTATAESPHLQATHVYAMAVICLVAGLAIGYVLRGSQPSQPTTQLAANAEAHSIPAAVIGSGKMPSDGAKQQMVRNPEQSAAKAGTISSGGAAVGRRMPTIEEMRHMADKEAAPLQEKLKSDPRNSDVLMQVGAIYFTTHQFKAAASYYAKAVEVEPGNVAFRTKLAIGLYNSGDADGAIAQLDRALSYDPKNANVLFDLGMIRFRGKQDSRGAVAVWKQLLKSNPQLSADRRATVEKLMADAITMEPDQREAREAESNAGHKSNSN